MRFLPLVLASTLVSVTSAASIQSADGGKSDWKYSVGWNGLTLPADAIGSTVTLTNDTATSQLQKRHVGGVYICTDVNWRGDCGYAIQKLNVCVVLGSEWAFKISSFGPDECTTCLAYPNTICLGKYEWGFTNPGDGTGGQGWDDPWNDKIGSFKCLQSC